MFPNTPRLKILLVEDDEPDAYIIAQVLEGNPKVRQVARAEDGVKALELVERGWFEPDIAIVDLHMPRKDGFSLLQDFAALCRTRFPSVILTSSSAGADAWRAMDCGAIEFVTKSASPKKLAADLDRAIEKAL